MGEKVSMTLESLKRIEMRWEKKDSKYNAGAER